MRHQREKTGEMRGRRARGARDARWNRGVGGEWGENCSEIALESRRDGGRLAAGRINPAADALLYAPQRKIHTN